MWLTVVDDLSNYLFVHAIPASEWLIHKFGQDHKVMQVNSRVLKAVLVFPFGYGPIFDHLFGLNAQAKLVSFFLEANGLLPLLPELHLAKVECLYFTREVLKNVGLYVWVPMHSRQNSFLLADFVLRSERHHCCNHVAAPHEFVPVELVIFDHICELLKSERLLVLRELLNGNLENLAEVLELPFWQVSLMVGKNSKKKLYLEVFVILLPHNDPHQLAQPFELALTA